MVHGMDVVDEKNYERFIFEKGGFMEIMVEAPLVISAHFVHMDQARFFRTSLQAALRTCSRMMQSQKCS